MFNVTRREDSALVTDEIVAIVSLVSAIWPHPQKTISELVDTFMERHFRYLASYPGIAHPSVRHLGWVDGQLVGHALTFERPVISERSEIPVMALSGVCVSPSYRRNGIGIALARDAFRRVDEWEFPVSIFQTTIPDFYQRLGAAVVGNRFFDSKNEDNPDAPPWTDGRIMIYPSAYPWPTGPVDLNGPGY